MVTHSGMKLTYVSATHLLNVVGNWQIKIAEQRPLKLWNSDTRQFCLQVVWLHLTSRNKEMEFLLCSQTIWKCLVNSTNGRHISDCQISDLGNVVVSLTEI